MLFETALTIFLLGSKYYTSPNNLVTLGNLSTWVFWILADLALSLPADDQISSAMDSPELVCI